MARATALTTAGVSRGIRPPPPALERLSHPTCRSSSNARSPASISYVRLEPNWARAHRFRSRARGGGGLYSGDTTDALRHFVAGALMIRPVSAPCARRIGRGSSVRSRYGMPRPTALTRDVSRRRAILDYSSSAFSEIQPASSIPLCARRRPSSGSPRSTSTDCTRPFAPPAAPSAIARMPRSDLEPEHVAVFHVNRRAQTKRRDRPGARARVPQVLDTSAGAWAWLGAGPRAGASAWPGELELELGC